MPVSVRFFPSSLDAVRAIQITSQLPVSHGYPVHIGDMAEIGIDVDPMVHPDLWDPYQDTPPLPQQSNEIALAWACGCAPENAIKAAKLPLAISHYPSCVFVSDRRTEEFHSSFMT
jgi:uncharacterized protein YcsI (UPF0317 family)